MPSCQEGPLCVSALGDSSVPNTECAGSCKRLERLIRDPFWLCSCCLQQAFTQVQSAQQASMVKQQLLLQQLWREMQVCGVLGKPVLSPALTVLAPEVKEKHSMFSVHTHACTKETTTEVYGGSVILTCRRGKGRWKWCDEVHLGSYVQLCTEINHFSEGKRGSKVKLVF